MSGCVGKIDSFDSLVEDWATYVERLEQYCLANKINDRKKVAVLLGLMGAKTYNWLRSLAAPGKPAEKTFNQIVEVLKKSLEP